MLMTRSAARGTATGSSRRAASRDPGREAWALLYELLQRQRRRFFSIAAELGLAPMQAHTLRLLEPETPIPMSEVAEALSCDASNVTGIIDRLESRGLVERRSDPNDRRVRMLIVTRKGAVLRERLVGRLGEPPAEVALLPAADQRTLRDILRKTLGRP